MIHTEYHNENSHNRMLYTHQLFETANPVPDPSNFAPKTPDQLNSMRKKLEADYNQTITEDEPVWKPLAF